MPAHKRRQTNQRLAIQRVLEETGTPLTGADLLEDARILFPSINAATLYRNLHKMEEDGEVRTISIAGRTFFDPVVDPHHYFFCHGCGRLIPIDERAIDVPGRDTLLTGNGYVAEQVTLTIEGLCAACSDQEEGVSACGSCPSLCSNTISAENTEEIECKIAS